MLPFDQPLSRESSQYVGILSLACSRLYAAVLKRPDPEKTTLHRNEQAHRSQECLNRVVPTNEY